MLFEVSRGVVKKVARRVRNGLRGSKVVGSELELGDPSVEY